MEMMLAIVALVLFAGMIAAWAMLPGSVSTTAVEHAEGATLASVSR